MKNVNMIAVLCKLCLGNTFANFTLKITLWYNLFIFYNFCKNTNGFMAGCITGCDSLASFMLQAVLSYNLLISYDFFIKCKYAYGRLWNRLLHFDKFYAASRTLIQFVFFRIFYKTWKGLWQAVEYTVTLWQVLCFKPQSHTIFYFFMIICKMWRGLCQAMEQAVTLWQVLCCKQHSDTIC